MSDAEKHTKLSLTRPVVAIHFDSTGRNPRDARICAVHVAKLHPDGRLETKDRIVNPEVPIPKEASDLHGVTDEKAQAPDAPKFSQVAKSLVRFIDGCDLAGFGITKYMLPLLQSELARVGQELSLKDVHVIDTLTIFHKNAPRDMNAACQVYLGTTREAAVKEPGGPAAAVLNILEKQLAMHEKLEPTVSSLAVVSKPELPGEKVDPDGKLVKRDGKIYFNFSKKHNGSAVDDVAMKDPSFLQWCLRDAKDLSEQAKSIIRAALESAAEKRAAKAAPAEPAVDASAARDR